jgi:hypothetical protein
MEEAGKAVRPWCFAIVDRACVAAVTKDFAKRQIFTVGIFFS